MIVEDGTGVTGADSYLTQAEATAYLSARGRAWTANNADLILATDYVDNKYSWPGTRESQDQGLNWPREDAFDKDGFELSGVPNQVKKAVAEAILYATELNEPLDRGGLVASVSVGPISESYFANAPGGKKYPRIDNALSNIVGGGGRVRVTR